MAKRRRTPSSANSMTPSVARYLTPVAEHLSTPSPAVTDEQYQHYVFCSPYPEQDCIYAQGISPRYEFDQSDHILDQPARLQLYQVIDYERAALPMNNGSPSWNPSIPEAWYRTQHQNQDSSQVFQHPENLHIDWDAHAIGSHEPFSEQLIRQQYGVCYTNSDTVAEDSNRSRPRGGRERGTQLPKASNVNAQKVREVGACLRCWTLNEPCSEDLPCKQCGQDIKRRKWDGCFRSFSHLGESIIPSILAKRLNMTSFKNWKELYPQPDDKKTFPLPLSLGFGKVFDGFFGCEFTPVGDESHSRSVRATKGETLRSLGLPIFPTFPPGNHGDGNGYVVSSSLTQWLKNTLGDRESMTQWRRACFPGPQDKWASKLLEAVWEHSCGCWLDDERNSQYHQVNETLWHAWGMTLLATILSFQITVPSGKMSTVVNHLQHPGQKYAKSSRQINRGVKFFVFDLYQKMQQKVMSQLDAIVKNSKPMNDREWGNMYCVSILLIVVINQAQLSLRCNYNLSREDQLCVWEETKKHLEESEAAFRTLAHTFARLFRDKEKERKRRDSSAKVDKITSSLFDILDQIQRQHRKEVLKYRKEKLGDNMRPDTWFSAVNRLRLISYYIHTMYGGESQ